MPNLFCLSLGLLVSLAPKAAAALPTGVTFTPMFSTEAANKFKWPVCMAEIPGAPDHFLVLEKNTGGTGGMAKVWMLLPGSGLPWVKKEFLSLPVHSENISNSEVGLLGLAFHPKFPENGRYFLDFNPADNDRIHAVEERRFDASLSKDSGIAVRLLSMPANGGHNGGTLAFGPDGMLYISVGDATDSRNSQRRSSLNGKILRIDVDRKEAGLEYAIPADNPFRGAGMRGEIWALGFRNPWRFSFDPEKGTLWAGDVGEGAYEEVNRVEKGGNYGWDGFEGPSGSGPCSTAVCLPPVLAYGRSQGRCIIGGHVYRADKSSRFYGAYLFADNQYNGPVYAILADGEPGPLTQVGELGKSISSMATDSRGNLYALGHDDGIIYKLTHAELKPGSNGLAIREGRAKAFRGKSSRRYRADGVRLKP